MRRMWSNGMKVHYDLGHVAACQASKAYPISTLIQTNGSHDLHLQPTFG